MTEPARHLAAVPEPTPAQYRARCLLALSLLNHRAAAEGLTAIDVQVLKEALEGRWGA